MGRRDEDEPSIMIIKCGVWFGYRFLGYRASAVASLVDDLLEASTQLRYR